jgi:hypothetical protein
MKPEIENTETRAFGIVCPDCQQFVVMGEIGIRANAPPSELHGRLREMNWQIGSVTCDNPECGSKTFGVLDRTILRVSPPS